jgi:hypothetical protein
MADNFGVRPPAVETDAFLAAAALTSNIYRFLKKASSTTVNAITAIGDLPVGVQIEETTVAANKNCAVQTLGQVEVEVSEAIALNADVGVSANGRAQNCVAGQYHVGTCVRAAAAAGELCIVELFRVPRPNYELPLVASGAAVITKRRGTSITEGWTRYTIDEDVVFSSALASKNLTTETPIGARIIRVQANLETLITATTAVKVGVGRVPSTADPNKYGLTSALTANLKIDTIPDFAVLAAAEQMAVFACDTAGDAAGTLDSGTVRVVVEYEVLDSLDDA